MTESSRQQKAKEKSLTVSIQTSIEQFGEKRTLDLLQLTRLEVVPHVNWGVVTMFPIVMQIEKEFPGEAEELIARAAGAMANSDASLGDLLNGMIAILRIERSR
ncbi:MAG: hypothetical protein QQN63_05305 [Nitrosopumilus sp.]